MYVQNNLNCIFLDVTCIMLFDVFTVEVLLNVYILMCSGYLCTNITRTALSYHVQGLQIYRWYIVITIKCQVVLVHLACSSSVELFNSANRSCITSVMCFLMTTCEGYSCKYYVLYYAMGQ